MNPNAYFLVQCADGYVGIGGCSTTTDLEIAGHFLTMRDAQVVLRTLPTEAEAGVVRITYDDNWNVLSQESVS